MRRLSCTVGLVVALIVGGEYWLQHLKATGSTEKAAADAPGVHCRDVTATLTAVIVNKDRPNNRLTLAMVLLRKGPEGVQEGATSIRAEAMEAAKLLRPLAALRQPTPDAELLNLAVLVNAAIAEHPEVPVRLDAAEGSLDIRSRSADARRLLQYVWRLAGRALEGDALQVRLLGHDQHVILEMGPPDAVTWLEDAEGLAEPADELARLAVRSLVHRLNGQLDRTAGGCLLLRLDSATNK